jgi:hypothetical protein
MKNKSNVFLIAALAICLFAITPNSSQAIGISIFDKSTQQNEIDAWIAGLGGQVNVVEDFENIENIATGWYQTLDTSVGTFKLNDSTKAGTGTTSYKAKVDPNSTEAFFEIRDYNENGRFNTTPENGNRYLDSADITSFTLEVVSNTYTNLFFYMTDPSDVKAKTSTSTIGYSDSIDFKQNNGSLWFIGIDLGAEYISQITWDATYNQSGYTNDGFGLDGFSTVAVPEPMTLFLLGSGLLGLGLYRRSRK